MSGDAFLTLDGVSVDLNRRTVVRDVSVELPRRCLVALVGPNGAGKTTLLRAVAGLLPSRGVIRLGRRDVAALSAHERALTFAYLPQGHLVHWPLPARDIVALGRFPHGAVDPDRLRPADAAAVERAMQATDTLAFADRPATALSGGERARVALARVLAVEAPIILADEPTAALDPHYQLAIMNMLRRVADDGALAIAVTHDLGLAARYADRVLVVAEGRLAAARPPETALAPDVLTAVFRIAVFRTEHEAKPIVVPWRTDTSAKF
jgi:iron complex transport system ATP-binding protein